MKKPKSYGGDKKRLLAKADEIEAMLAEIPEILSSGNWEARMRSHQAHRDAANEIAERLRQASDGRVTISYSAGTWRMSCLGVRTTCTSGLAGLFRNWIAAARCTAGEGA